MGNIKRPVIFLDYDEELGLGDLLIHNLFRGRDTVTQSGNFAYIDIDAYTMNRELPDFSEDLFLLVGNIANSNGFDVSQADVFLEPYKYIRKNAYSLRSSSEVSTFCNSLQSLNKIVRGLHLCTTLNPNSLGEKGIRQGTHFSGVLEKPLDPVEAYFCLLYNL